MDNMIKLPKGVIVHVGSNKWRGEIPAAVCPEKYLPKSTSSAQKRSTGDKDKESGGADE